ncbi:hypothetical protein GCM10011297_14930 [Bacterioplanes sanyensis]|uniref:hypothetical protein n=1 Tax=Bacterioplanes sanyensis TaxID=1249553 RepID=UPI001675E53E|nr:hypothetical protein [Bacterioplanes sanyensis]GGY43185.1 hypothetical protein GCM10011297_14930 [Bacterioplanes sanyensis]
MTSKIVSVFFGLVLLFSGYCYASNESMDAVDIERVAEGGELKEFVGKIKMGDVDMARRLINEASDKTTKSIMQGELYLLTDNVEALCSHDYYTTVSRYYRYACQLQSGIYTDMRGINEKSYLYRTNELLKAVSKSNENSVAYRLIDNSDIDYGDKVFALARFIGYETANEYCKNNNELVFECEFVRLSKSSSIRLDDLNLSVGYEYSQALYVVLLAIESGSPDLHRLMRYFGMVPSCSTDYYICNLIKANASIYKNDERSFEINMAQAESLWSMNEQNLVLRLNAYVHFCRKEKLMRTLDVWKASEEEYEYWQNEFDKVCSN